MKKCIYCGAEIEDNAFFCTECGKPVSQGDNCPHCGASVNEGDAFCQSCGNRIDTNDSYSTETLETTQKKCPNCGASVNNGDNFCENCGKNLADGVSTSQPIPQPTQSYDATETSIDYKKIIIPIVIGLVVLVLFSGGWYGYKEYSAYSERKQAREKFVADSLEQVRKDSIKLAKQKEQERIEAEKIAEFREKMSFNNFIGMLKNFDKESYAKKCGLSLVYKDITQEEFGECIEIVYGYEVEKGGKKDWGYEILSKSNHACYFIYVLDTSTSARLAFKDEEDLNIFYDKVKEYGMIRYENSYFIPNKKLSKGQIITIDEFDNSIYEKVIGMISSPSYNKGWYEISIGLDF